MKKVVLALAAIMLGAAVPAGAQAINFSFFVTSRGVGNGANLGGLRGADQHCQSLAYALGSVYTWQAYLSTVAADGQPAVNARDRIGAGPWHNFRGELIARDVTELHSEAANLTKQSILTEQGRVSNGRGDTPNQHDILTGSNPDGTVYTGAGTTACGNWRSNGEGSARVGHHDRQGGGDNPTSWNSAHDSRGCSQEDLVATGGNGYFYCFAIDAPANEEDE